MTLSNLNSRLALPVQVRVAQSDDAESIKTVINSAFRPVEEFFVEGNRIDVEGVLNLLSSGQFLLAERADELWGCVYLELRGAGGEHSANQSADRAYLGLLAVDPQHQQSGLGSVLMDAAEDYCRGLGARFMDIKVVSLRTQLLPYYRKRGYVEMGTSSFPTDVKTKFSCHFIEMSKPLMSKPLRPDHTTRG